MALLRLTAFLAASSALILSPLPSVEAAYYPGLLEEVAAELAASRLRDDDVYDDVYGAGSYGVGGGGGGGVGDSGGDGVGDGEGGNDVYGSSDRGVGAVDNLAIDYEDPRLRSFGAEETRGLRSFRDVGTQDEEGLGTRRGRGLEDEEGMGTRRGRGLEDEQGLGTDDGQMFHDVVARMADYIDWDDTPAAAPRRQEHRSAGAAANKPVDARADANAADEDIHHSHIFGSDSGDRYQYMTGGAGEGVQWLKPEGTVQNKQEVKTDRFLPAYCDPPNPCPIGFTAEDGCDPSPRDKFTADFSKLYQASQECHCDREHNYGCPNNNNNDNKKTNTSNKSSTGERNSLLSENLKDLARMFSDEEKEEKKEQKKAGQSNHPSNSNNNNNYNNNNNNEKKYDFTRSKSNPYLVGEPLKRVAKKFPTNFHM